MDDTMDMATSEGSAALGKPVVFGFVFGIVAPLVYFLCVGMNLSLFAYYPEVGQLHGTAPLKGLGPPMFWYGWILNAAMAGTVSGGMACLVPVNPNSVFARALGLLVWAVPIAVIIAILYFLRHFFA